VPTEVHTDDETNRRTIGGVASHIGHSRLCAIAWRTGQKGEGTKGKTQSPGKDITDVDTAKFKAERSAPPRAPCSSAGRSPSRCQSASRGNPKTGAEAASGDEAVDLQGRPESFWRQTLGDAREKVTALENEANVLVLRFTDLQNRFYREDNGFRQQQIQQEMQKTLYEQDLNRQELAKSPAAAAGPGD